MVESYHRLPCSIHEFQRRKLNYEHTFLELGKTNTLLGPARSVGKVSGSGHRGSYTWVIGREGNQETGGAGVDAGKKMKMRQDDALPHYAYYRTDVLVRQGVEMRFGLRFWQISRVSIHPNIEWHEDGHGSSRFARISTEIINQNSCPNPRWNCPRGINNMGG